MTIELKLIARTNEELDAMIASIAPPNVAKLSDDALIDALRQRLRPLGIAVFIEPIHEDNEAKPTQAPQGKRSKVTKANGSLLSATRAMRSSLLEGSKSREKRSRLPV